MDYSNAPSAAGPLIIIYLVVVLLISLVSLAASWRIFTKAGKPGWVILIPIYNFIVFLQIVGRPAWWILLLFVPFVNLAISMILALDLAKAFGKSTVFGVVALWLIPVGYFILGFGSAKYVKNGAAASPAPAAPVQPTEVPIPTPSSPPPSNPSAVS